MTQKTLAVCGPSWFTSTLNMPGKSWPEMFCATYDWRLESLAIGGCTNFAVALQINKAIQLRPDFIIVGSATWDRLDVPIQPQASKSYEKVKEFFTYEYWTWNQPYCYVKNLGITNIQHHRNDLSSTNKWVSSTPTIHSNSLNTLAFMGKQDLIRSQHEIIKGYITELYDSGISHQTDCWIISDACRRLIDSGIPFLLFAEPLFTVAEQDFTKDIDWIPTKNLITKDQCDYQSGPAPKKPTDFHYCPDTTGPMVSKYVHQRIMEFLGT